MKEFFSYYTPEAAAEHAFGTFSPAHVLGLLCVAAAVGVGLYCLRKRTLREIHKVEKVIITLYLLGEWFYYGWCICTCTNPVYTELIPLHMCSICVYLSAAAIYLDHEKLRRYVAVCNILGACIALLYPATVAAIYPTLSYRVFYFFISHGTLAFIGMLQVRRFGSLSYKDMRFNLVIVTIHASLAFFVNLWLHTDYLFIGAPPTLGIIRVVYDLTGVWLYLPIAILALTCMQLLMITVINGVMRLATYGKFCVFR